MNFQPEVPNNIFWFW